MTYLVLVMAPFIGTALGGGLGTGSADGSPGIGGGGARSPMSAGPASRAVRTP